MNFTREPIIETIITPREGCKIVVKNSKGNGEEYLVDALEVVTFGKAYFFRSLEKPRNFLLPVTDYEVFEVKETRPSLKTPAEKTQKGAVQPTKEFVVHKPQEEIEEGEEEFLEEGSEIPEIEEESVEILPEEASPEIKVIEKRRDRKKMRRRHGGVAHHEAKEHKVEEKEKPEDAIEGQTQKKKEAPVTPPSLLPPPPVLISETLGRYRDIRIKKTPHQEPVESSVAKEIADVPLIIEEESPVVPPEEKTEPPAG